MHKISDIAICKNTELDEVPKHPLFSLRSHRLRICLLLAIALYVGSANRMALSVGVVCMTNATTANSSHHRVSCVRPGVDRPEYFPNQGEMDWSASQQTMLLSSSFYGSFMTVWFSGSVADQFGAARVLRIVLSLSTILTVSVPLLSRTSFHILLASRVLIGMVESFFIPSINCLATKWFPKHEKTTLAALYSSGLQFAAGFGSLLAAELCRSEALGGWPSIFYIFGTVSVICLVLFTFFVNDNHEQSPWTSENEKYYLTAMLPPPSKKPSMRSAPWKAMLCSPSLHAVLSCSFAIGFSTSTLQAYLPTYLKEELGLPVKTIGHYTLAPFVAQIVGKTVFGPLADVTARRGWMSLTNASKLAQFFGCFGAASMLLLLIVVPSCENPHVVLPILIGYGIVYAGGLCGYYTSMLTMSPLYTGTIFSLSQLCNMLASICTSSLVNMLTTINMPHKWAFVFGCAAFFQSAAGVHYLLCGSTEKQPWADVRTPKKTRPV